MNRTFKNPLPVAVLLQKAIDPATERVGIIIGMRNIEPKIGQWALIGGHIENIDKDVWDAARREFFEETGIRALCYDANIFWTYCDGRYLLLFTLTDMAIPLTELERFTPNHECSAIRVAWEPERLAFPSHTVALAKFFEVE